MTISGFLKDRLPAYLIMAAGYTITFIFLRAFGAEWQLVIAVTVVFLLTVFFHELWELYRKKPFYDRLVAMAEELDKKYLLPEMLSEPLFLEGKTVYDALYACNKSMTEHVNEHRRQAADFREYIEMWVHEAKLPVAAMRLVNHNNPGEVSEKMNVQLNRMDNCIDNVLYYARCENAEKDYIIKSVSLKKTVSHVAIRNRELLLETGASLMTEGLDVEVMTDGKWLEFILGQFLANSIKYTDPGRPLKIDVSAEKEGSTVILRFRDNGIGIPANDLPYVFEKSFTGRNGRKDAKSTGMGLFIVKNLCDRLGHGISAASEEGRYTEICIIFGD